MHILSKGLGGKLIRLGKPKTSAGGQILMLPTVCHRGISLIVLTFKLA